MERKTCPCARRNCPRHGDCAACRAHHAREGARYPCACERRAGKGAAARAQEPGGEAARAQTRRRPARPDGGEGTRGR